MGIAGVDTRAITRRLRVDGCLNGAICTDASISGEQLLQGRAACEVRARATCAAALPPRAAAALPPLGCGARRATTADAPSDEGLVARSKSCSSRSYLIRFGFNLMLFPADEDLVARTKSWTIVGKDLIKEVSIAALPCTASATSPWRCEKAERLCQPCLPLWLCFASCEQGPDQGGGWGGASAAHTCAAAVLLQRLQQNERTNE